MIRHVLSLVFGLLLLATQAGCNVAQSIAQEIAKDHLLSEIDAAESRWQEQNITNYRIVVRSASVWHLQTDTIIVHGGTVTEHSASCLNALLERDGECEIEPIDPQTRTVEGLFAKARDLVDLAASGDSIIYVMDGISFEFDPIYSYPELIASSPPNAYDAAWGWIVEEFEVLS